jgi:hypothetical protein
MKIDKLTKEQEDLLLVYRDKWLAIGLDTRPANREAAEEGIELAYKVAGLKRPNIVWCLSPLSSGITRFCVFKIIDLLKNKKKVSVSDSVRDSVWDSVRASISDSVRDSVRDSIWDSVRDSINDRVWASVGASVRDSIVKNIVKIAGNSVGGSISDSVWDGISDSLRDSIWDSVGDSVWASVGASVSYSDRIGNSIWDSGYGQHDANWLGFYDYFSNVLRLEQQTKKLKGLWIIAKNAGWFLPHENICWISERHNICKLKDGRIHSETGPAIAYPDGFSVFALNGVRVPQWLVDTKKEDLKPEQIKDIDNAEIRREFVRKIGLDQLLNHATSIEKSNGYELVDFGPIFRTGFYAPYLVMENPSLKGIYHVEGIHEDCKTVKQALNWRNQSEDKPLILT